MAEPGLGVRVVLAEEQSIFRESYRAILEEDAGITLLHASDDTDRTALMLAVMTHEPDVMVIGTRRFDAALGATLSDLAWLMPRLATVLLIGSVDDIHRDAMSQMPGLPGRGYGFLLKQNLSDQTDLTQSIRAVAEGRVVVDAQIMESLLPTSPGKRPGRSGISAREMDVLGLMADGYRNKAIAERLQITTKTVERHIQSIYAKLGESPNAIQPRAYAIAAFHAMQRDQERVTA